tara:strand:+ start:174 stop:335 length:162 start_codon:yes stop_codon:yes gene_type:complete
MEQYEITVNLNNSYDVVKTITATSLHLAITDCRELIKKLYNPSSIWFTDIKKL